MRIRHFFSMDPDPDQLRKKNPGPDPALNRNEEKKYIYILGRFMVYILFKMKIIL